MVPDQSSNARRDLVESLLGADLAARHETFFRKISELVARLAASGNRYSTTLVSEMEDAGRRELRVRAESIQAVWKRALTTVPSIGNDDVSDTTAHALSQLAQESNSIEGVVLGVQMGSLPHHPGFLSETENLLRKRLLAELQLPDHAGGADKHPSSPSDEIIELKPNVFGFGLNLRALGRRITAWWQRR